MLVFKNVAEEAKCHRSAVLQKQTHNRNQDVLASVTL